MNNESTPLRDYAHIFALQKEYERLRGILLQGTGAEEHVSKLEFTPKALRTSLRSAFVSIEVMRDILIDKGIITEIEFYTQLNQAMTEEIRCMENYLSVQHFRTISLLGDSE